MTYCLAPMHLISTAGEPVDQGVAFNGCSRSENAAVGRISTAECRRFVSDGETPETDPRDGDSPRQRTLKPRSQADLAQSSIFGSRRSLVGTKVGQSTRADHRRGYDVPIRG